jgi:hypothetical protein
MAYPNGARFTPPQAATLPPFLPETHGAEYGLAKYRNVLLQGVTVYALSDGTFRQDISTPENTNTSFPPYPLSADGTTTPNIIDVTYTGATPGNPVTRIVTTVNPYVVTVYQGGHTFTVTSAVANALANYTAHGTGYADVLVAL